MGIGTFRLTFIRQHVIDRAETRSAPTNVRAITDCPVTTNAVQLRSFLGMANYYGKFIPAMSTTCALLCVLTKLDTKFQLRPKQQAFFKALKSALLSD